MSAVSDPASTSLERETLRLNRRYVTEIVERFGLCPWAERAQREGRIAARVFEQSDSGELAPSLGAMNELAARAEVDVALFIYPLLRLNRLDFEHFARLLRARDAERYGPGEMPFAIATFHPQASPVLDNPDRLVPFLRRTPDPTLQLVRESTLRQVRGDLYGTSFYGPHVFRPPAPAHNPTEDVRERIGRANHRTVVELGSDAFEAVFADILRDRERTHARLALERTAGN